MQAGIIAHKALKEHLKFYGYAPARIIQGICTHQDRDVNFTLVVDIFGIRYRNKKDADHLISELQAKYEGTQDWIGVLYWGITLKWDYKARQLDISIPGYVKDALQKFQHPNSTRPQNSLHQWKAPKYGYTVPQLAHPTYHYPILNPDLKKIVIFTHSQSGNAIHTEHDCSWTI